MREFIGTGDRIVTAETQAAADRQFASMSADEAWRIKLGRGGLARGSDGLTTYIAPSGKEYRAKSLDAARAMHDGHRPNAAMAGGGSDFEYRQKIFNAGTSKSAAEIMDKTAADHRLMAGTATRE